VANQILKAVDPFDPIAVINQLQSENYELRQALAKARKQLLQLSTCRDFEILSRHGLETAWAKIVGADSWPAYDLVFFDLDGLKQLNERIGYVGANNLIRQSFAKMRGTEYLGRWYSGDEFVGIFPASQSKRILQRLIESFAEHNLSFAASLGQCLSPDLAINVQRQSDRVQAQKSAANNCNSV
jgi:GGDEF domain-containing protein